MSKNYFLAVDLPTSYHAKWTNELIKSMSPIDDPECQGIDLAEIRFYHARVFDADEKKFLSKIKTYNNIDHDNTGKHRTWKPQVGRVFRFLRDIMGIGGVPLTPSNPINTPGHVLILARIRDGRTKDGREMR